MNASATMLNEQRNAFPALLPSQSPPMLNLLGLLEQIHRDEQAGKRDAAIALTRSWLTSNANGVGSFVAWYEFGRMLSMEGDHARAEMSFRSALEKNPDLHPAKVALGQSLEAQGRIEEAIATWQAAIQPNDIQVALHNSIGRVFDANFRFEEAEQALTKSLQLQAAQPEVIPTLLHLRQRMCRWPLFSPELGIDIELQRRHLGPLTALAEFDDPRQTLSASRHFLEMKGFLAEQPALVARGEAYVGHKRIRVGFLSADFQLHATSIFFAPLLERLDRKCFEVYALDMSKLRPDFFNMRERLLKSVDHHVPLQSLDDIAAAQTIRELEIDVLVDMAGLTSGARPGILMRRCAPVQVSYLGFLGSCGIPTVDYILVTADMFPMEHKEGFSEKPLFLPRAYVALDIEVPTAPRASRVQCGLPDDAVVYCTLLNPYKIRPEMFACWMRILKATPGSVLWLVEENATARRNLTQRAIDAGVDVNRLVFSSRIHPAQYRSWLGQADLFLDTFPYSNGATAHDAILANLPIITRPGNTVMSRFTAHLMRQLGLDELVVTDVASYESLAIELGNNPLRLAACRNRMHQAKSESPLFDINLFVKEFGETLSSIVPKYPEEGEQ